MMRTLRLAAGAAALLLAVAGLTACGSETEPMAVVHVPQDASLAEAGQRVADGGIILIEPGTYTESLEVRADDVTVRGTDRNAVILDGELTRSNGVVMTGQRPAVENLTVRNFLQNGVLITGVTDENGAGIARGPDGYLPDAAPDPVPGYLVQRVTAQNNGLYGIYAFNRTGGAILENLASGGSDSGIYVGQCERCAALVAGNVVTLNAVGIELANASNVTITGNRIVGNRIGMTVLSNYLEAHGPTTGVQIIGNVIDANNEPATPEQANGAFGTGVGLAGTVDAVVRANRISGNQHAGVWVTSSDDFAPTGNVVEGNEFGDGTAVIYAPSELAPGSGDCFRVGGAATLPDDLDGACPADGLRSDWIQPDAPSGIRFADVARTPERAGLDTVDETPRTVPDAIELPNLDDAAVPDADLLADAA